MPTDVLEMIVPLTEDEVKRAAHLNRDDSDAESSSESTERVSLTFKAQANMFRARRDAMIAFLKDDIEDTDEERAMFKKRRDNYEELATSNWGAVLDMHK